MSKITPKNIIITSPKKLKKTIAALARTGARKIHVLADFDNTLTKAYVNGKKVNSLISVLRDEKYLTPDYPEKSYALYYKYHPIEDSYKVSPTKKKRAMNEWWSKHFKLLIESDLTKKDIARAVKSDNIRLRDGGVDFFKLLRINKIPLVIMSASGLGDESVKASLRQSKIQSNNIYIISNTLIWDKKGRMIGFKKPIIHSANKDEAKIKNFPVIWRKMKKRKNVILLGDRLGDVDMVTGFNYDHLIKIGFYNHDEKENLKQFKKKFDITILNDSSLDYVNQLLKEITSY
ncbi:MAG: hypothetical protein PHF50_00695 [Patescibacteria group bacterium]|nr:hypothetical protein [Patescibacteria group bacterium]